jgi:PKD repeat protein
MRKKNSSSTWVVVLALGASVLITLGCSGKSTSYPTQPPARNLTVPVTSTLVVADFEVTESDDPRIFGFQDTSTGNPTAWRWDFGDGGGARGVQTVVHKFKKPGLYAVTLTVFNPISQDAETKFVKVAEETEEPPPVVEPADEGDGGGG